MSKKRMSIGDPQKPSDYQKEILATQKKNLESGMIDNPDSDTGMKVTESSQSPSKLFPALTHDYYDKFDDYIEHNTLRSRNLSLEDMQVQRAENQSNWQQAGHAIGRVAANIGPQIISGVASMVDVQGYWDAEHAAQNGIVKWADSLKQHVDQELLPIYEDPNAGPMNLGDFGWWMSRGSGLVESIGSFLAQGFGAAKLASLGVKGIARLGAGLLAETIGMGGKTKKAIEGVSSLLLTTTMLNQSEATIEAAQVYQQTYEEQYRANGFDDLKAREAASNAASTTMNLNRLNIIWNLTSASAFLKPMKQVRKLLTQGSALKTIGHTLQEGGQEAIEELINHVASNAGMAKGKKEEYTFENALEDMGSMEGFEAAFLGALGGIAQTGGTNILNATVKNAKDEDGNKITKNAWNKARYEKQQQAIKTMQEQGVNTTEALKNIKDLILYNAKRQKAEETGDQVAYDELTNEMFEVQALNAFSTGTTQVLEDMYKVETQRNPDEVGQDYIDRANQAIKNLRTLESVYHNYDDRTNVNEILYNKANEIRNNKALEFLKTNDKNVKEEYYNDVQRIAKKYKFREEIDVPIKENGEVKETLKRERFRPLSYSSTDVNENTGDTEENKKIYNEFLAEVQQLESYNNNKEITKNIDGLNESQRLLKKQYKDITTPEYQEKYKVKAEKEEVLKKAKTGIASMDSISDLEKLKQEHDDKILHGLVDKRVEILKAEKRKEIKKTKQSKLVASVKKSIDDLQKEVVNNMTPEQQQALFDTIRRTIDEHGKVDKSFDKIGLSVANMNELKDYLDSKIREFSGELNDEDLFNRGTSGNPEEGTFNDEEIKNSDAIVDHEAGFVVDPTMEEELVEKERKQVSSKLKPKDVADDTDYAYAKTEDGSSRGATLNRNFKQTDNGVVVEREEITDELINTDILKPEVSAEETEVTFEIDETYAGEVYIQDSKEKEKMLWGQRVAELYDKYEKLGQDYRESEEYKAEVPIRAVDKDGKFLGWHMHTEDWIQHQNVETTDEGIIEQKELVSKMRQVVLQEGSAKSVVLYKGNGHLMISKDEERGTVANSLGGNYTLAVGKDDVFYGPPGTADGVLNDPITGRAYAIVISANGSKIALPLQRESLSEEHIETIAQVVKAYALGNHDHPLIQAIKNDMGLNTTIVEKGSTNEHLRMYLSMMINLQKTQGTDGLSSILDNKTPKLHSGIPLISVTATGIEFGRPEVVIGTSQSAMVISPSFNESEEVVDKKIKKLKEYLTSMLYNANIDGVVTNQALTTLNEAGDPTTVNYSDFVSNAFSTNVMGVNIGSEAKPHFVHMIQPAIIFDTSFSERAPVEKVETSVGLKAQKADIEKRRKEELDKIITSIFPDTEVKEILYHRTNNKFTKFDSEKGRESADSIYLNFRQDQTGFKYILPVIIDVSNPIILPQIFTASLGYTHNPYPITSKVLKEEGHDAAIGLKQDIDKDSNYKLNENTLTYDIVDIDKALDIDQNLSQVSSSNSKNIEEVVVFDSNKTHILTEEEQAKIAAINTKFDAELAALEGQVEQTEEESPQDAAPVKDTDSDGIEHYIPKNDNTEDIEDDIPVMSDESVELMEEELQDMFIEGINVGTQNSLIDHMASAVYDAASKNKNKEVNIASVLEAERRLLQKRSQLWKENGLPKHAARIDKVLEQFDKVAKMTRSKLQYLSTGNMSNPDVEADEAGLIQEIYADDAKFTVDSKKTASAELKKFLGFTTILDKDGKTTKNLLGQDEKLPFDIVYNTLHKILANKPADFKTMLEHIELHTDIFPWLQTIADNLKSADIKIQNEFVSDMTKHVLDMSFVMWSVDKNGNYSLQNWSANSSSVESAVRAHWSSAAKTSMLLTTDENNEYIFDPLTVTNFIKQVDEWEVELKKNPKFKISYDDFSATLGSLGISINEKTYQDLVEGRFKNKIKLPFASLFTNTGGLMNVLRATLKKEVPYLDSSNENFHKNTKYEKSSLMTDTVVKNLARLEAYNSMNVFSNSFSVGGKTVYSYTNNNFLINRARDLKDNKGVPEGEENKLIQQLRSLPLTENSSLLDDLQEFGEEAVRIKYASLEVLKRQFTPSADDRKLNNLTAAEHEVVKIGLFFSGSKSIGSSRRKAAFFYPTMSDKSTMMILETMAHPVEVNDGVLSDANIDFLYSQAVLPEIQRMTRVKKDEEMINGYDPSYLYFFPTLNSLDVNGRTLRDIINGGEGLTDSTTAAIKEELSVIFQGLVESKKADWQKLGIGVSNKDTGIQNAFLDKTYFAKIKKPSKEAKIDYAIQDFVFNYLISNVEAHKVFAGDPALYSKISKNEDFVKSYNENNPDDKITVDTMTDEHRSLKITKDLENTFINMGKRLAGDIAPGIELADSANNKYRQVFFEDTRINSSNVDDSVQLQYFNNIMSSYGDNYKGIQGSDAQEYTTWREHLYVMRQLGRLTSGEYKRMYDTLEAGKSLSDTDLGLVMQPMKPVYVGNVIREGSQVDRRMYIKSSSFPLLPQLTKSLDIDKVRTVLEDYESGLIEKGESYKAGMPTVRASFGTANKVGATTNAIKIFGKDGYVLKDIKITDENTLLLERKNFRIQQDVPYKKEKNEINIGTQARSLLFVNILNEQVTKDESGAQLMAQYDNHYKNLFEEAREKLSLRLGLTEEVETTTEEDIEIDDFVDNNFQDVVALLAESKINVFFDEENEFKKC